MSTQNPVFAHATHVDPSVVATMPMAVATPVQLAAAVPAAHAVATASTVTHSAVAVPSARTITSSAYGSRDDLYDTPGEPHMRPRVYFI